MEMGFIFGIRNLDFRSPTPVIPVILDTRATNPPIHITILNILVTRLTILHRLTTRPTPVSRLTPYFPSTDYRLILAADRAVKADKCQDLGFVHFKTNSSLQI